jgi:hypothetical protein
MRSPKQLRPLLGLAVVLAAGLAVELAAGPFFLPEIPQDQSPTGNLIQSPSELPAVDGEKPTYSEVVARPLFSPSRRPHTAAPASQVEASTSKSETFDLIGVIISADRRMALLRGQASSEVLRAIEGQNIDGWEVRTIKPSQVVLGRGDDSEVLEINDAAKNAPINDAGLPVNPTGPVQNSPAADPGQNPPAADPAQNSPAANPGQNPPTADNAAQKTPTAETPAGDEEPK